MQRPLRGFDDNVPFQMQPQFVTAGKEVRDVGRSAFLVSTLIGLDTVQVTPADSGPRLVEMVTVLRAWATASTLTSQRAVILRSALEGNSPLEIQLYSTRAADPALRPRLRISYALRTKFGIP